MEMPMVGLPNRVQMTTRTKDLARQVHMIVNSLHNVKQA